MPELLEVVEKFLNKGEWPIRKMGNGDLAVIRFGFKGDNGSWTILLMIHYYCNPKVVEIIRFIPKNIMVALSSW